MEKLKVEAIRGSRPEFRAELRHRKMGYLQSLISTLENDMIFNDSGAADAPDHHLEKALESAKRDLAELAREARKT